MIWTTLFWRGALERLLKTVAQTLVGYVVVGTTGLLDVDWLTAASVAGAAGLASLLTSIGNADFVAGTDPGPGKHVADPDGGIHLDRTEPNGGIHLDGGVHLDNEVRAARRIDLQ